MIAVLGLGEAGTPISLDLVAAGADVRGYDPLVAAPSGVAGRADEADAVRDADVVLSLNSALDAEDWPNAAASLDQIRQIIAVNMPLGFVVIIIGVSGRYWSV